MVEQLHLQFHHMRHVLANELWVLDGKKRWQTIDKWRKFISCLIIMQRVFATHLYNLFL